MSLRVDIPSVLWFIIYVITSLAIAALVGFFFSGLAMAALMGLGDTAGPENSGIRTIALLVIVGTLMFIYGALVVGLISLRRRFGWGTMIGEDFQDIALE